MRSDILYLRSHVKYLVHPTDHPSRSLLSYNDTRGSRDHEEVHEQTGEDLGEARRADSRRYQAVLRERGEGRLEAGDSLRPLRDVSHHSECHLRQHSSQGGLAHG